MNSSSDRSDPSFIDLSSLDKPSLSIVSDDFVASSAEDLRREFYTKTLLIKFAFDTNDPAQYVRVSQLYEVCDRQTAQAQQIPVSQWESFIKEQLKQPQRYLSRASRRRKLGLK